MSQDGSLKFHVLKSKVWSVAYLLAVQSCKGRTHLPTS